MHVCYHENKQRIIRIFLINKPRNAQNIEQHRLSVAREKIQCPSNGLKEGELFEGIVSHSQPRVEPSNLGVVERLTTIRVPRPRGCRASIQGRISPTVELHGIQRNSHESYKESYKEARFTFH